MDISTLFLAFGSFLAVFTASIQIVLSTLSLQRPGMDKIVWPTALVFWIISMLAASVPLSRAARRAIAASPHKRSFAVGYVLVASFALMGICVLVFTRLISASGI